MTESEGQVGKNIAKSETRLTATTDIQAKCAGGLCTAVAVTVAVEIWKYRHEEVRFGWSIPALGIQITDGFKALRRLGLGLWSQLLFFFLSCSL